MSGVAGPVRRRGIGLASSRSFPATPRETAPSFPEGVREGAGIELHEVQQGIDPSDRKQMTTDRKQMTTIGRDARELRLQGEGGAFRVVHVARPAETVHVPHALSKKTRPTAQRDIDLAAARLRGITTAAWHHDEGMSRSSDREEGPSGRPTAYASVWNALEDTPERAARMHLCSQLVIARQSAVGGWDVPSAEVATRLGIAPRRPDDPMHGRIARFDLDALVDLAARAGRAMRLEIAQAA